MPVTNCICVALYRRCGEVHRLVVDGMRVIKELVADDDVISCIKMLLLLLLSEMVLKMKSVAMSHVT